tara:strand:- start:3018 stop:3224 length:207 start_codon:yes stop_codon:yes gene_type:complete
MESTNKPECPKCESFLNDQGRCKNCETLELFDLGLKISRRMKAEALKDPGKELLDRIEARNPEASSKT